MSAPAESRVSIWRRRVVSMPLYVALAALLWGGAPLWLLLAAASDLPAVRRNRFAHTRAVAFFAAYLGCELWGLIGAAAVWIVTLGGRGARRERFVSANFVLQRLWARAIYRSAVFCFSMTVETEGLGAAAVGPFFLFVRHSSTADTVLAAALIAHPERMRLRYVLKRDLLWDPCLDVVGRRLPNAFVARSSSQHESDLLRVERLARDLDDRSGVLMYPEGTRFRPAKLTASVEALRRRGEVALAEIAATFTHVLPPRTGGPIRLMETAPGVDVLFLDHTGFEGAASFREFWSGALVGRRVRVRVRRVPASEIPVQARATWLFERWKELDTWVRLNAEAGGAP